MSARFVFKNTNKEDKTLVFKVNFFTFLIQISFIFMPTCFCFYKTIKRIEKFHNAINFYV